MFDLLTHSVAVCPKGGTDCLTVCDFNHHEYHSWGDGGLLQPWEGTTIVKTELNKEISIKTMQEMRTALEKGRAVVLSLLDCDEDTEEEQVGICNILSILMGEGKRITLVHPGVREASGGALQHWCGFHPDGCYDRATSGGGLYQDRH